MGECSKIDASNQLYEAYVKPYVKPYDDGDIAYEQDDANYDLANPIYRAGYRYALQQVQFKIDEMKNLCFKTAVQQEKDNHI